MTKTVKHSKHSKVMTIANQLVKQGYSRSMAMIKAWIMVKLPQIKTTVSGVTFGKRQKALEHLRQYNPQLISISLQHESNNPADSNAVQVIAAVRGKGSYCVGYLPKAMAQLIAPLLDKGTAVKAEYRKVKRYLDSLPYGLEIAIQA